MIAKWSFPTQTIAELMRDADNTILLLSRAVPVPAGSRLLNYRKVLAEYVAGKVPYQSERARVVYRALTEFTALSVIARSLAAATPSQKVRELLSLIIGGQDLPDDEKNTLARNTQLHLYIAALLAASGTGAEFEEPDLLVQINRRWVGIAAKRITSIKQFEKRISEGEHQLRRARKRGIVWIDFSDALLKQSGIFVFDDEKALSQHHEAMEERAYQVAAKMSARLRKSEHLTGVVLSWIAPRTIRESGTFETAEFILPFSLHEPDTIAGDVARLIHERVEAGLRELEQLV